MLGGERGSCRRRSPIPPPGAGQLALPMPDPEEAARLSGTRPRRQYRSVRDRLMACGVAPVSYPIKIGIASSPIGINRSA